MKIAQIECLALRGYEITDLGLVLKKGEVVERSEDVARISKDLDLGRRMGAVSVRYIQRSQVVRNKEGSQGQEKRVFVRPTPQQVVRAGFVRAKPEPTPKVSVATVKSPAMLETAEESKPKTIRRQKRAEKPEEDGDTYAGG